MDKSTATTAAVVIRRAPSKRAVNRPIDETALLSMLPPELGGTDLAASTVRSILNSYPPKSKPSLYRNAVRSITYVPAKTVSDAEAAALPEGYPTIDTTGYLFSARSSTHCAFGFDNDTIRRDESKYLCSLWFALHLVCDDSDEDALDVVFRKSLREICVEYNNDNFRDEHGIDARPVFLSGRYLELRLLHKVRSHYKRLLDEDIVEYLLSPFPRVSPRLQTLVDRSKCTMYVKTLLRRYNLTADTFVTVVDEPVTVNNMRVWTNREIQDQTNLVLHKYIDAVYGERQWEDAPDFALAYAKLMKSFVRMHREFLTKMVKASELMTWVCFGFATNHAHGSGYAAVTHYATHNERFKPVINDMCWNLHLTIHRRRKLVAVDIWVDADQTCPRKRKPAGQNTLSLEVAL